MRFYKINLRVRVMGCDGGADGLLKTKLPCPPTVGLHIADIYSAQPLYVDQVFVSHQTHRYTVWCATIIEEEETYEQIMSRFVGEWEWMCGIPNEPEDDDDGDVEQSTGPDSDDSGSQGEPDNEYDKAIKALLRGRQTNTGEN